MFKIKCTGTHSCNVPSRRHTLQIYSTTGNPKTILLHVSAKPINSDISLYDHCERIILVINGCGILSPYNVPCHVLNFVVTILLESKWQQTYFPSNPNCDGKPSVNRATVPIYSWVSPDKSLGLVAYLSQYFSMLWLSISNFYFLKW